jgi:small subunit ribosomal protein S8
MSALTDPIADFLTRIRNGSSAGIDVVMAPYSKMKGEIARILQEEGYIWNYEVDTTSGPHPQLKVKLKYDNRLPVIRNLKRISKPGLRNYVGSTEIPRVLGGLGIAIVSTSHGLMAGYKARRAKLGGELLATVW